MSQCEFDYGLFTNLQRIIIPHDFSPNSFKLKRGILPLPTKCVSDLKITCHIRLKFFLWTKLQENLLLAKNLISATAPLSKITHQKWHNYPFSQRNKTKKAMGVEVGGDGSERGWKIGGLHKIGGLGRSANYGHFRARLGLVGSLKSKRMSNWIAIWKLKLHENENKIWKKTF